MRCARLAVLLALLASSLSAQLRLAGPRIHVGRGGWSDLVQPQVAMAPSGEFLVVWAAFDDSFLDSSIVGRLFGRSGLPATEEPLPIGPGEDPLFPVQIFPRLAVRPDGTYAVLWANAEGVPCLHNICDPPINVAYAPLSLRFLGADGNPLRAPSPVSGGETRETPRFLLPLPAGDVLVLWTVWNGQWSAHAQRFSDDGQPHSAPFPIALAEPDSTVAGAAAFPDGSFVLLLAGGYPSFAASVQRYSALGEALGPAVAVPAERPFFTQIAVQKDGSFVVGWSEVSAPQAPARTFLRFFGGSAPAKNIPVPGPHSSYQHLRSLTADGDGNTLIVWEADAVLYAQLYDRSGTAKGEPVRLRTRGLFDVASASSGGNHWVVTWSELDPGLNLQVYAQRLGESCAADPETVCLGEGRFEAEVSWVDHLGRSGRGQARSLTDDTGAFWFFGQNNLELVVKVLDGRHVNGSFWTFFAGLSDVEYDLRVRDALSGEERVYHNPAGTLASRADVQAFPDPLPPPPPAAGARVLAKPSHPPVTCAAGERSLCLQDARFRAEVEFVDSRTGETRPAAAVPLTDESGAFWFFDKQNVELFVKVLDGRALNGRFWVFHGALTDVEYTLTIFDEVAGHSFWSYHNPRGQLRSGADTQAF